MNEYNNDFSYTTNVWKMNEIIKRNEIFSIFSLVIAVKPVLTAITAAIKV